MRASAAFERDYVSWFDRQRARLGRKPVQQQEDEVEGEADVVVALERTAVLVPPVARIHRLDRAQVKGEALGVVRQSGRGEPRVHERAGAEPAAPREVHPVGEVQPGDQAVALLGGEAREKLLGAHEKAVAEDLHLHDNLTARERGLREGERALGVESVLDAPDERPHVLLVKLAGRQEREDRPEGADRPLEAPDVLVVGRARGRGIGVRIRQKVAQPRDQVVARAQVPVAPRHVCPSRVSVFVNV